MGIVGWLEAVLSWPRRFIVGTDDQVAASAPAAADSANSATDRIASAAMGKLPLRARLATTVGGAAGRVSRLSGRGDGSVIGGVVGLRMEPDLLRLLAADRQIVLVTGTNGKTTTTRLITAALGALGLQVASNAFGANMEAGLASALGQARSAPFGVLEVDERYLPAMIGATGPKVVTLLNLSRDQMDRAAEIWLVARRWREALADAPRLPGRRQRRRPAHRLGGQRGEAGHLGRGRASAGTRTPGAARNAGRTCAGTTWAGGAASAASPGPRPGGCWTGIPWSTRPAGSASCRSPCPAGPTGLTRWSRWPWPTTSASTWTRPCPGCAR